MSTRPSDRLYGLLPAIYRQRDAVGGEPLRTLLAVAEDELRGLEDAITRLYDSWFIETCDDWAVPYLADLLGITGLEGTPRGGFVPRAFVAGAIGFLRRKGVVSVLADVAAATTGWGAHAVEYYALLSVSQHLEDLRHDRGRTLDVRDRDALRLIGSPLDPTARRPDMRTITGGVGRHNLPNIGLFLYRLQAFPLASVPADNLGGQFYSCDPLGAERQLFTRPAPTGVPEDDDLYGGLPVPLSSALLVADLERARETGQSALIGPGGSLQIRVDGVELGPKSMAVAALGEPVGAATAIIDPERGLIRLSGAAREVLVDFYYGAAADIGGGPYDRRDALADRTEGRWQATVGPGEAHADLPSALGSWADYCMSAPPPHQGAIVIADSGRYSLSGSITLPAGTALAIVAASGVRPAIRVLQDGLDQAPGALMIAGAGPGAALALDGLLIAAENIQLLGAISLDMAHCTLLPPRPGGGLLPPIEGAAPGIALAARHCLLGPLRLAEGTGLSVADSVVDAAGELAVGPTKDLAPGPDLVMARSTVFGGLRAGTLSADDSIITGPVTATAGELRFCYAPPSAAGPSRWRCQPDLAQESAGLARARGEPAAPSDTQVLDHIRPRFTSAAYLSPAYAQLAADCPTEIAAGAEDGAELGVYHDLFQPQRMATLNAVVSEFLPVGAELGILFIT